MVDQIRPKDLVVGTPNGSAALLFDNGVTVNRTTPLGLVDAARPVASQADAESGVDNAKIVTPLRVGQAIDALSVTPAKLASTDPAKGAGLVGYSGTATYTDGTAGAALVEIVRPTMAPFYAVGDDATNNDAAINAAVLFAQSRGGGVVELPYGNFRYTNIVIPVGPAVTIRGQGFGTALIHTGATGNGVEIRANDSSIQHCRLTSSVTRTNYDPFVLLAGGNSFVTECSFDADKCGIKMTGVNCDIYFNVFANGAAGARRIWATGGDLSQSIHDNLMHYQPPGVQAGIFTDDSAALKIYNNDIIGQGFDLFVSPGNGQVVASLRSYDNFYDTALGGIAISPQGTGRVIRGKSSGDWASSHSANGIVLDSTGSTLTGTTAAIDGFDVIDSETHLNGNNGIVILGTKTINVRVDGVPRARANAAGDSVFVGQGVTKFSIKGLQCEAADDLNVNQYGIYLAGLNDDYEITGCDLRWQSVASLFGHTGWSPTKRVWGNRGYVTASSGTSAVASGSSSVTISHGLSEAPRQQDISITPTIGEGSNPIWLDSTTITSTQFTVRTTGAAASTLNFAWKASVGDPG